MLHDEVVYHDIERVARKTNSWVISNQGNEKAKESFNGVNENLKVVNEGIGAYTHKVLQR